MLMVAGLWPMLGKKGEALAVLFMIWVMISRIVLGMHYPTDVLVSPLLSFISVYLTRKAVYFVWEKRKKTA